MMITKSEMEPRAQLYTLLSRLYRTEVDAPLLAGLKGLSFPLLCSGHLVEDQFTEPL